MIAVFGFYMSKVNESFRTTVSLSAVVQQWADELMAAGGYNGNFSAFVAALVRDEKRRGELSAPAELKDAPSANSSPAGGGADNPHRLAEKLGAALTGKEVPPARPTSKPLSYRPKPARGRRK